MSIGNENGGLGEESTAPGIVLGPGAAEMETAVPLLLGECLHSRRRGAHSETVRADPERGLYLSLAKS